MQCNYSPGSQSAGPANAVSRSRRPGPVLALLLLAPVISELLYGAVRVSTIFIVIPEIMTWGCSALLIRECVRRWGKGWQSMLLMGLALAVAEEWIIQQTSISPLVGVGEHGYGRVWGVNCVYLLWALGYESVWVVILPVRLTELLFPQRRRSCWLRRRGLIVAGIVFVWGAFGAWYGWTQRARVNILHMAPYSPPPAYLLVGLGVIVLLAAAAYILPSQERGRGLAPPAPWIVGATAGALGTPWAAFASLGWGVGALPWLPVPAVLAWGVAWAGLTLFLMYRWTRSAEWGDRHQFAVVFGGVLACMLGGFAMFAVTGALRIDWIGKLVLNLAAFAWLVRVGRRVRARAEIRATGQ